ncbi:MarR family winged helix-turn-helix transcriptional regulator [Clostridium gasigenes]|uniref:DNA-binding transcriptional regulator, MarR family n=1 Tax=Clostridium gasigenes TaxID=94869 RepID=A0A1H0SPG5_9CLOT|nr:MarR family transcriptional regulator [Clostridium gasigenes]MBB6623475.1 MarR family transcriptional regulator [Clostridium gasigenes]MBB6715348.1 MarR family transcriptional regulator [Clostridium gasigenes]MBU3089636.1 MarR family transcriptional regulator [Clostridium gasigenes]MBU3104763.1 MarR family transcriptional regulator [Clostridium gasigenes]MBU3108554.1 MarR family transcriptional regulator [Clostridium gasigenes]
MDTINLNKISDDLVNMLLELRKKTFNKDHFIKGACMPPSHFKVIFSLSHSGPVSLSHLANTIGVSKPNMTPIIDKLIQDGFINRYEDPNDRRILRVELTEKANELLNSQTQKFKDILCVKLSDLADDDLNSLEGLLEKLTPILSKLN